MEFIEIYKGYTILNDEGSLCIVAPAPDQSNNQILKSVVGVNVPYMRAIVDKLPRVLAKPVKPMGRSYDYDKIKALANNLNGVSVDELIKQFIAQESEVYTIPKDSFNETLAEISFFAGIKHYYSGDSSEDMQTFIRWAKEFEAAHHPDDWAFMEYMDEVEKFFNTKYAQELAENPAIAIPVGIECETNTSWPERIGNNKIVGFECLPVTILPDGIEVVDDDETNVHMWSVYATYHQAGHDCFADCETKQQAENMVEMLEAIKENIITNLQK